MRGGQPFARVAAQFALIAAAAALTSPLVRADALADVPRYESRGKRKFARHDRGGTAGAKRAATKRRNVLRNRRAHR